MEIARTGSFPLEPDFSVKDIAHQPPHTASLTAGGPCPSDSDQRFSFAVWEARGQDVGPTEISQPNGGTICLWEATGGYLREVALHSCG